MYSCLIWHDIANVTQWDNDTSVTWFPLTIAPLNRSQITSVNSFLSVPQARIIPPVYEIHQLTRMACTSPAYIGSTPANSCAR